MRPFRIGLVAAHASIDYPQSLRLGVQNTLEELGHTLVPIAELVPYHTPLNGEDFMRVALELAKRLNLDNVIVPVGCLGPYVNRDNARAIGLATTMSPENTLIVERSIPGYRCVNKDNNPGMHECMRHLIETCGFTRIAFISGPETSVGAREREAVYFEEMAAHGLPTSPSLFGRGDFAGNCAEALNRILDARPDVQAVAFAADLMAYTAYEVCLERKLAVGEDIAITGFDDHPRSAHLDPPLSTVHITAYDLGCMAAREAVRMCAGEPQQEYVLNSHFVARSSCGESVQGVLGYFGSLLREDPFPQDKVVDAVTAATLSMAGPRVTADFKAQVDSFFSKIVQAYRRHVAHPEADVWLFSSQDLNNLFAQDYRAHLSLEGFHATAITLLEAMVEESHGEDANWVVEQISHLHLRIARLLSSMTEKATLVAHEHDWHVFHMLDGALREDNDPGRAYRLMLEQLVALGIREADVFLLPEPISFIGSRSAALSDKLRPIGRVVHGAVEVPEGADSITLQELLDYVLPRYEVGAPCTVGGIMAGTELLGIAAIDAGSLDVHAQFIVYQNLGFALKHLQVIANEREMNALLNQNNLLLKQQSQHDEMTGLLNRRGFINRFEHLLQVRRDDHAAVIYLDLDGLKTINDTFGHDVGDDAIRAAARILAAHIAGDDLLSRLGGDEFVAYVAAQSEDEIVALNQSIQADVKEYNATTSEPFELGISAGWFFFAVDETAMQRRMDYLAEADERLYAMKRSRKESRRYCGE